MDKITRKSTRLAPRPYDMSQLDYLWTNFGAYYVSETPNAVPQPDVILTEQAISKIIIDLGDNDVIKFEIVDKPGDDSKFELRGINKQGIVMTFVDLDKENYLVDLIIKPATQVDIDNGVAASLNDPLLVATLLNGDKFYTNLKQFILSGYETHSIKVRVDEGKIAAELKVDNNIIQPTVRLKITENGLQANAVINPKNKDSQVVLVKTEYGLDTKFSWDDGQDLRFQLLTYDQYLILGDKYVEGKIYFISDLGLIYLNGVKYGASFQSTNTILVERDPSNNTYLFHVKLDPDENLITTTNNGLKANIYWEEL